MIFKKTAAAIAACLLTASISICAHAATTQSGNTVEFDSAADCKIVAMYNKNGDFVGVQKFDDSRACIDYSKLSPKADGECTVKIFSWDSSTLEPKADMLENKAVVLNMSDLDTKNGAYPDGATDAIASYKSLYFASDDGKVREYKLSDGSAALIVNGVTVDWNTDNIYEFLESNKIGRVTLVNTTGADGIYNIVSVTYCKSALIGDVMPNGTVYFKSKEIGLSSQITFDQSKVSAGDLRYTIKLDGKEIDFSDLQPNDVISVAYDVSAGFRDSEFYDVIVSRGAVKGKIEEDDYENSCYKINGIDYKYDEYKLLDGYVRDPVGMDAALYVDTFGRIVYLEELSSGKNMAILNSVYFNSGEEAWYANIINPNGTEKDYEIKDWDKLNTVWGKINLADILDICYADYTLNSNTDVTRGAKTDVQDRVITYKVNDSGLIYNITTHYTDMKQAADREYDAVNKKIGAIKFNENTEILDVCDYITSGDEDDIASITASQLNDTSKYTAFGYDKLSNGTYAFVLITKGIGEYNDYTQPAVFIKSTTELDNNGIERDAVTLLHDGAEKTFIIDYAGIINLNKGDVIVFKTNHKKEITQIDILASMQLYDGTTRIPYADRPTDISLAPINAWNIDYNPDTNVELDYGAITDAKKDFVVVTDCGKPNSTENERAYTFTEDSKVYIYYTSRSDRHAFTVGSRHELFRTIIPNSARDDDFNIIWDKLSLDTINFAFIKTIDGKIDTILFIEAPDSNNADSKPDYTSIKTAIAEAVRYDDATETAYVKLILSDGTAAELAGDSSLSETLSDIINEQNTDGETVKRNITDRVIEYKLDENGRLAYVNPLMGRRQENAQYDKLLNKVGSIKLNESTSLLDVSRYIDSQADSVHPIKNLTSETYTAYGYGKYTDGTYSMVLFTFGTTSYTDDTQTAIFVKNTEDFDSDGNTVPAIEALYNGEQRRFLLENGVTNDSLEKGDVIVFCLNKDFEICRLDTVAKMQLSHDASRIPYEDRTGINPVLPNEWNPTINPSTDVKLSYGRIVNKTNSFFTVAPADKNVTTYYDETEFDISSDTKVYVYDYKKTHTNALFSGSLSDIVKTPVPNVAIDPDTDAIDWTHSALDWTTNYVFVKSVWGEATEVLVIKAPDSADYGAFSNADNYDTSADNKTMLISRISPVKDADGLTVYKIYGYIGEVEASYTTTASSVLRDMSASETDVPREYYSGTDIWNGKNGSNLADILKPGDICGVSSNGDIFVRMVSIDRIASDVISGSLNGESQFYGNVKKSDIRDDITFGMAGSVDTDGIASIEIKDENNLSITRTIDSDTSITYAEVSIADNSYTVNFPDDLTSVFDIQGFDMDNKTGDFVFNRRFRTDNRETYIIRFVK